MFGFRGKVLFTLVVYFAGFATAIYVLAPVDAEAMEVKEESLGANYSEMRLDSEEFAEKASVGLHKFVSFAEGKASEVKRLVKAKLADGKLQSEK